MTTKPGTTGTSKSGSSKVKWKKTGNPVWDAYGKAWENDTNAGKKFTATQGLGRGTSGLGPRNIKPKSTKPEKDTKTRGNRASWKGTGSTNLADNQVAVRPPLTDYQWNLPPHQWSLPTKPGTFNDEVNPLNDIEQYRRGRLWWYASVDSVMEDASKTDPRSPDRKYGFQFTWNPESYSTGVSLNTDTTPSVSDRFVGVAGAFPSGETISFNLRLDRTNDFACARNAIQKDYASLPTFDEKGRGIYIPSTKSVGYDYAKLLDFYTTSISSKGDMTEKIQQMLELGTVADLEYLYKAVNGDGWSNAAGRKTSDIGYLAATLLRVDIGPLSYIGYILNLNVNHIAFSQDMTPIRTDVSISMNLMASAGQTIPDKGKK
jgi:hypothetical protein